MTKQEILDNWHEFCHINLFSPASAATVADWIMSQWPEEPKAIGFDEWWKSELHNMPTLKSCWEDAQAALLASGQYIKVPPVEEWPDSAVEATFLYRCKDIKHPDVLNILQYIATVPRPAPAWQPKEGDFTWIIEPACRPYLVRYQKYESKSGTIFAAFEDVYEIDYSLDQFRQRGRFMEVK